MAALDLSLPLAALLRSGTSSAHEAVENTKGAGLLTRGELDKHEYVRFLMMLWHVYDTLERCLERHSSHPTLQPTYNPTLLARAPSLASDISFLLQVPESSWKAHPIHQELLSPMPKLLAEYILRLQELSNSADPSALLAHAYVRYLGDLSGGQIIRYRIVKAYGLDGNDGSGVFFYDFKVLGGSNSATKSDMKKIKEWYRQGMNHGASDNPELKSIIVQEANKAFDYNNGLFSLIRAPTGQNGVPVSVVGDSLHDSDTPDSKNEFQPTGERSYVLDIIIPAVIAAFLAYLMFVVGGFRGSKDYLKLQAFEQWLAELFSATSE